MIRVKTNLTARTPWNIVCQAWVRDMHVSGHRYQLRSIGKDRMLWEPSMMESDTVDLLRWQEESGEEPQFVIYWGSIEELVDVEEVHSPFGGGALAFCHTDRKKIPRAYGRSLKRYDVVCTWSKEQAELLRAVNLDPIVVDFSCCGSASTIERRNVKGEKPVLHIVHIVSTKDRLDDVLMLMELTAEHRNVELVLALDGNSVNEKQDLKDRLIEITKAEYPRGRLGVTAMPNGVNAMVDLLDRYSLHPDEWSKPLLLLKSRTRVEDSLPLSTVLDGVAERSSSKQRVGGAVTVVMSNRDRTVDFMYPSIRAVMKQLVDGDRFYLVDQGSSEGTIERTRSMLQQLQLKYLDVSIHLLKQSNDGPFNLSRARNAGAVHALDSGVASHLLFIDNDVVVPQGFVNHMVATLEGRSGTDQPKDCVTCYVVDGAEFLGSEKEPNLWGKLRRPATGIMIVRAKAFHDLGFDESFVGYGAEDTDFIGRLRMSGGDWMNAMHIIAYHQPHEKSPHRGVEMERENEKKALESIIGKKRLVNPGNWGEAEEVEL